MTDGHGENGDHGNVAIAVHLLPGHDTNELAAVGPQPDPVSCAPGDGIGKLLPDLFLDLGGPWFPERPAFEPGQRWRVTRLEITQVRHRPDGQPVCDVAWPAAARARAAATMVC